MQPAATPQPWQPSAGPSPYAGTVTVGAAPPPPRRLRAWPAILALFFLGAFIPESVVTASTSPLLVVAQPLILPYVIAFYGAASVLIREALVRGKRGWPSLIILGLAFGIVNEGVVAGTWYKVAYPGYGFIGEVDVAWAVGLTVFHAAFSVVVPIALVGVLLPQHAERPWLGRWGFVGCWFLLGLITLGGVGMRVDQDYRIGALVGAVVLVIVALVLPAAGPRVVAPRAAPRLWTLRWSAFGLATLHDVLLLIVPPVVLAISGQLVVAQYIDIALLLAGWVGIVLVVRRWTARADWGARQTLAVIAGGLVPGIILSALLPQELALLAPLFALPFLGFLVWATRHLGKIAPQHP